MRDFILSLHLWTLAIVLNAWLMGFALVSFWVARRWILPRMRLAYEDAYIGAAVAQSCMVLYALIAALTAVGVWQRYSQVSGIVSSEATIIANLWRDFGGYPPEQRDAMREVLRGYTEQVIHEAWPQQRAGQVPREGVEWMDRLQTQLFAAQPGSKAEEILHAETLRSFHDLVQARRQRLDSVGAGLPGVLWFVLLPGAMGCIVMFMLFRVENPRYHAALLILLAGFIAMVLFVIIGLDRPFSGDMGITADSYQLIYDHHMRP
jgi:hypothetical protein